MWYRGKLRKRATRQLKAMRIAVAATAALFTFAVGSGAVELAAHGLAFSVFREAGAGETGGSQTDAQFLAQHAHRR